MGKRARIKKQAKVEQLLEQREQIGRRVVASRSPMIRLMKLTFIALIVTAALLYVGQVVNKKIANAENKIEELK